VGWWLRLVRGVPEARSTHSVDTVLKDVDDAACTRYILGINHELARINNNKAKKDAPKRTEWYKVPGEIPLQMQQQDFEDLQHQQDLHQQHKDEDGTSVAPLDAVVDMKYDAARDCMMYKCRWVGWGSDADTWEPQENLQQASEEIARYLTKQATETATGKRTASKATPAKHKNKRAAPKGTLPKPPAKKSHVSEKPVTTTPIKYNRLPDASLKDESKLVAGAGIWVKYYGETSVLEWFHARVVIVSHTTEVSSARVVRVSFLDGSNQKETLNLKGLTDADKLQKCDPRKYEVFDWSSDAL
jgi:hypothetical protein